MPKSKPYAYFAVQKVEGQPAADFAIGGKDYIDQVLVGWRKNPPEATLPADELENEPDFTHESALTEALSRAVDFGLSQYELIMVATVTPALFSSIITRDRVLVPTAESAELVEDDESASLYALTEDQYFDAMERREDLNQLIAGVAALPKATLLSIVATFDTIVVDIVSKMLKLGLSEWLVESERTISASRLSAATSIDDLIDELIAEEIYQFSRGSHDEQAKYIEQRFGVGIKKHWKRWPDYIEVFERRNLIAHGEQKFNKRYVNICKEAGHKGSSKLFNTNVELTNNYLNQACDVLLEFAILLPFSLWRKVAKDKEQQAFSNLSEAAFKLISSRRYRPAERILEFALTLEKAGVNQDTRQRLVVNRATALKSLGEDERAIELLEQVDWSATSDLFKMCVASVRGEAAEVVKLMPAVKGANALAARDFKQWPCFSFVRDNPDVKVGFEKAFGESLVAQTITAVGENPDADEDLKKDTVH